VTHTRTQTTDSCRQEAAYNAKFYATVWHLQACHNQAPRDK